jgi:transposase
MIAPPANTQIWIAAGVTDMRRGFTGLSALVQTALEQAPLSGHVFAFRGRRGDLIKLLWFDGDDLCQIEQLELKLEELEANWAELAPELPAEPAVLHRSPASRKRHSLPDHLPREVHIRSGTWHTPVASSRPTPTLASTSSMKSDRFRKRPAWRIFGANSST